MTQMHKCISRSNPDIRGGGDKATEVIVGRMATQLEEFGEAVKEDFRPCHTEENVAIKVKALFVDPVMQSDACPDPQPGKWRQYQ
jgi:hypothetical protein